MINQLNDKVKAIGTQASVGSKKHQDFPLMFAALFETETFKKLNIDFRPKDLEKIQDTGWELRHKYLRHGFQGKILEMKSTRIYKKGPFGDVICGEYYLKENPRIFASHFGRGSSFGLNKYLRSWKKYIFRGPFKYLFLLKGIKEKNKWLKICKQIIDEQCE